MSSRPLARIAERARAARRRTRARSRSTSRSATASPPAPAARRARPGPTGSPPDLRAGNPGFVYRNLAVDGRDAASEVLEQLPEALELEPDLVTVVCGANDVAALDPPRRRAPTRATWRAIFGRLRDADRRRARSSPRPRPSAGTSSSSARAPRDRVERGIAALNDATRAVAAEPRRPLPRGRRPPGPRGARELRRRRPAPVAARPPARGRAASRR